LISYPRTQNSEPSSFPSYFSFLSWRLTLADSFLPSFFLFLSQLRNPSVRGNKPLWIPSPEVLREATEGNLPQRLDIFIQSGDGLFVTDSAIEGIAIQFKVTFN
jgi:hypothetical protein